MVVFARAEIFAPSLVERRRKPLSFDELSQPRYATIVCKLLLPQSASHCFAMSLHRSDPDWVFIDRPLLLR